MSRFEQNSPRALLELCTGYFFFYALTGISVKYFLGAPTDGFPGMSEEAYLVYNTVGGSVLCLAVVLFFGWLRTSNDPRTAQEKRRELLFLSASGVCTAVVIPATTLMYTLPISVMVAMVIMRAAVIIISRAVDEIQKRQGLLKQKVVWEENAAVLFALLAISLKLLWNVGAKKTADTSHFEFIHSVAALSIMGSYFVAYSLRIYIMNYYKNRHGASANNRYFFGVEQVVASLTMLVALLVVFALAGKTHFGFLQNISQAVLQPHAQWGFAGLSGFAYGLVAFFSVFIFMFKGRTATFSGLVNRLTSLLAGTSATLASSVLFRSPWPAQEDWWSLILILIAVGFLYRAETRKH